VKWSSSPLRIGFLRGGRISTPIHSSLAAAQFAHSVIYRFDRSIKHSFALRSSCSRSPHRILKWTVGILRARKYLSPTTRKSFQPVVREGPRLGNMLGDFSCTGVWYPPPRVGAGYNERLHWRAAQHVEEEPVAGVALTQRREAKERRIFQDAAACCGGQGSGKGLWCRNLAESAKAGSAQ